MTSASENLPGVAELLSLFPSDGDLVALLSYLSGTKCDAIERELTEHIATRVFFLLLGSIEDASNFRIIQARLAKLLDRGEEEIVALAEAMARATVSADASTECRKIGLRDLPYPVRKRLLSSQRDRCAICGWNFKKEEPPSRPESDSLATLDHRIPYALGGDSTDNLWILCAKCNRIKEAALHIGEHGRLWINNYIFHPRNQAVAFWALRRDGSCTHSGCLNNPMIARLSVIRRHEGGPWCVDNCTARCLNHIGNHECIEY